MTIPFHKRLIFACETCRNSAFRDPSATPNKNENGPPEGKPLIYLVAGTGFEPVTFGL
jgi:hypothetical protein